MTREYVLQTDGVIKRRDITESVVNVSPNVFNSLLNNCTFKHRRVVYDEAFGHAGLAVGIHSLFWSVEIEQLMLNCPFQVRNDIMVPHFASSEDPILHLAWQVPLSIRLRYVVQVSKDVDTYYVQKSWLLAFSESGACWKLPLANIYDDCALCTGDFGSHSESALGSLKLAMEQFKHSQWNADLWSGDIREKTIRFFRFDPRKTPFEQLGIDTTAWTNLCYKIATPITEQVVL